MGISLSTFYTWKHDHPEFSEALKEGKAPVNVELEDQAFDLALGKVTIKETVTEITYEGQDDQGNPIEIARHVRTTEKQIPPKDAMLIFLLKNRMPDKYREKREDLISVTQADFSLLDDVKGLIESGE